MHALEEASSHFDRKRRARRARMIIDVTSRLISSEGSLTHREARSLVSCAEKAILELFPGQTRKFDTLVRPFLERLLVERWPCEELHIDRGRELVN